MAERRLAEAGIEEAQAEARILAAHGMGRNRAWLLAHPEEEAPVLALEGLLTRREEREPLAYLTGRREFYGRTFRVRSGALIPRPETEGLVDVALSLGLAQARVLDVGTGTGAIAVTLALEQPGWKVAATDVSPRALRLAEENADALGARVTFYEADLWHGGPYDLIVSNPPYIAEGSLLMPEVGRYEPPEALFGGSDGLDFYRRLAAETPSRLIPGGWLVVEHGSSQGSAVREILRDWRGVETRTDLAGLDRVTFGQRA